MKTDQIRLLLLGPSTSGKGAQASRLVDHHGFLHWDLGDHLREEIKRNTVIGGHAVEAMEKGELVPDKHVTSLFSMNTRALSQESPWVITGFPRTLHQATVVRHVLKDEGVYNQTIVVMLQIPQEEALRRKRTNRSDDTPEVLEKRFKRDMMHITTVWNFFEKERPSYRVDGFESRQEVQKRIESILDLPHRQIAISAAV